MPLPKETAQPKLINQAIALTEREIAKTRGKDREEAQLRLNTLFDVLAAYKLRTGFYVPEAA